MTQNHARAHEELEQRIRDLETVVLMTTALAVGDESLILQMVTSERVREYAQRTQGRDTFGMLIAGILERVG